MPNGRTLKRSAALRTMQDVRELIPEDDETNDENDRQKHHAHEIVDELIVLPHAH